MAELNNAKLTLIKINHGYNGKYCLINVDADLKTIQDECSLDGFFDCWMCIWKHR